MASYQPMRFQFSYLLDEKPCTSTIALRPVGGTEFVIGERQAVGRELSHNFP